MKWPEVSFSKVAEVITGNTPPKKDPGNYGPGVPWVKPPDLDAWEPVTETNETLSEKGQELARLLPKGTVMVCCIGSIGRVGIAGDILATNQQINSLVFNLQVDNKFGYYYCRSIPHIFKNAASKAVVPILNKTNFSKIKIPLPPLSEQRQIVEILGQADRLRKLRAEADKKAERILPSLFIKMFGDPATNPMGWETKTLHQAGAKVRYGLGQPPETSNKGVALIRATNIKHGFITSNNMIFVDPGAVPKSRNAFLLAEEILVVRSGAYTGDIAQVTKQWEGSVAGYDLIITPGKKLKAEFIEAYLLTDYIQNNYFTAHKVRAGQPHLNASQLKNTPFIVPDNTKQEEFRTIVDDIRNSRKTNEISQNKIEVLFKTIIHRAFSGDLTASWRQAHMKELLQEMKIQASALD